jgi:hypothetical protein
VKKRDVQRDDPEKRYAYAIDSDSLNKRSVIFDASLSKTSNRTAAPCRSPTLGNWMLTFVVVRLNDCENDEDKAKNRGKAVEYGRR